MKINLSEYFEENIEMSTDKFIAELENHLNNRNQIFHGRPISGRVIGTLFEFKINPPFLWVDPFKSKVRGQISLVKNLNLLKCRISPNLTTLIFLVMFFFLLLISIDQIGFIDPGKTVKSIISMSLLMILLIVLVKIKVKWDTKRLKNILEVVKTNCIQH